MGSPFDFEVKSYLSQRGKVMSGIISCAWCGRKFVATRHDAKFCHRACLDKWFVNERKQAVAQMREMQRRQSVVSMAGSLAEKAKEELAKIDIKIPENATPKHARHKCQGCGRSTTNERYCSPGCRMKHFRGYENDEPRRLVRRI